MKKIIASMFACLFMLSCTDDSWKQELEDIKAELANQKQLIEALQQNSTITGIEQGNGQYTIKFSDGQAITLTNGKTPIITIGENGNWFIDGVDTSKPSQGEDGSDGLNGSDGKTPTIEIGANGNWIINGTDTGVQAECIDGKDAPYITNIIDKESEITFYLSDGTLINVTKKQRPTNNILYGKKWAVIGDSFSSNETLNSVQESHTINSGIYTGKNKVYMYLIGNKNNMIIQDMALGGRTIATPADGTFTNAFTNISSMKPNSNYLQIDEDVDYITIYLGINDSHHAEYSSLENGIIPMGTIDDNTNTTFYGAWNILLKWIKTNRPYAKIGILVSNGCERDTYRLAEIEIAKKWGIPYIDLNGDERTPMMIRSTNPNISQEAKNSCNLWQRISEDNLHPNVKAHEYESTFIETFLRNL